MCTSHTTSRLPLRHTAALIAAFTLLTSCRTLPRSSGTALSLDDLSWIDGCWTMTTPRGSTITERWARWRGAELGLSDAPGRLHAVMGPARWAGNGRPAAAVQG